MHRSLFRGIFALILCLVFTMIESNAQGLIEDEIIVELSEGYTISDLQNYLTKRNAVSAHITRKLGEHSEIYLLNLDNFDQNAALRILAQEGMFSEVFPSRLASHRSKPNDSKYEQQWNMQIMDLERAWEYATGGTTMHGDEIVVAVLDDGFFLDNEDLMDNIYSNPFDQEGDMNGDGCPGDCGVDDDGDGKIDEDYFGREPGDTGYDSSYATDDDENGYRDDVHGLYAKLGNDSHPVNNHGTSVAGIVGATGNNEKGVTGVNWNIKILPLSSGLSEPDIIECYNYIANMRKRFNETNGEQGAFIVASNYSLGINYAFPEDYPTWCSLYDKMGEQGIISAVATTNDNHNVDIEGDMPSLCPSNYMIAVTSTDSENRFAENGFGKENIDLAAPGEDAITITPQKGDGYGTFPGTSAATPHVAGAIGLLYSIECDNFLSYFKNNPAKVDSLANIVVNSGDELENLQGLTKSSRRINVLSTMVELAFFCGAVEDEIELYTLYPNPVGDELTFSFNADPREEIYVEIYNTLGQNVQRSTINFPLYQEPKASIKTDGLIQGVYFLSINQGKKRRALRFFKE